MYLGKGMSSLAPGSELKFGEPSEEFPRIFECFSRLPMKMITSTRYVDGVTVVDIRGRIELGGENAALRDLICDLLREGHAQILLNLGDVHYIDSSGLGALVSSFTTVRRQGGELKLLNLTNKVHDLMQITKLYTVFDIANDEATGVKSFAQSKTVTA
jgi:anti-sigma B factor antagonist